jgi:hypothetical protein
MLVGLQQVFCLIYGFYLLFSLIIIRNHFSYDKQFNQLINTFFHYFFSEQLFQIELSYSYTSSLKAILEFKNNYQKNWCSIILE